MRHPFDGIVTPAPQTRRSWLASALAALGAFVFGSRLSAAAPPARAEVDPNPEPNPRKKTTQAKGEEGRLTQALNEQGATTKALREEGAMTRALNENGGPRITTLALNEEGAKK
jgi:uncharacterized protein RhaS with RHS repeats